MADRTVTALYDSRDEAQAAQRQLTAAGIAQDHVQIHAQDSGAAGASSGSSGKERTGFLGAVKDMLLPPEDRAAYSEGLRRGAVLLTAKVDDNKVDQAVQILEGSSAVDLEQRSQEWRSSGWTGELGQNNEQAIPVVEEQMTVGKREVERGGVRVRSYITERPVSEQVSLREENVSVERRPVNQPIGTADQAFQERNIEMRATGEEAVVNKEARVVEEVVVSKDVNQRTQNVQDTVRKTEVEVDNDMDTSKSSTKDRDRNF